MAGVYQEISNNGNGFDRKDIQEALDKAAELRALHAALLRGNSPGKLKPAVASPVSCHAPPYSPHDYPVFTPSYEDEALSGYQQHLLENRNYAESWSEYNLNTGKVDGSVLSDYRLTDSIIRRGLPSGLANLERNISSAGDEDSVAGSSANNAIILRPDDGKSLRNSVGDLASVSSCNRSKPAFASGESDGLNAERKHDIVMPYHSQPKTSGPKFAWLFLRQKKKTKNETLTARPPSEEASESLNDFGRVSVKSMKKELEEAKASRDAALIEVAEMKSSLGDLRHKLEYFETYSSELKNSLRQALLVSNSRPLENLRRLPNAEDVMPVSEEVMVEGFLQIVSEARLSVKQFCKILVGQIDDTDFPLVDNLNLLLQPYKLSLNSKYSKLVLYHMEAVINKSIFQDFENRMFQINGAPKILNPQQERQSHFRSFVALRNHSWNEVLRKGTKYYSGDFSKYCDEKMSIILATLGWTRSWPEQLLQAFFVAAKCIWLLHLLSFSFNPPIGILRVDENRPFEPHYMEDIIAEKQRSQVPRLVKVMVMPGFYVLDSVLRCKVLCRYKSVV